MKEAETRADQVHFCTENQNVSLSSQGEKTEAPACVQHGGSSLLGPGPPPSSSALAWQAQHWLGFQNKQVGLKVGQARTECLWPALRLCVKSPLTLFPGGWQPGKRRRVNNEFRGTWFETHLCTLGWPHEASGTPGCGLSVLCIFSQQTPRNSPS